MGMSLGSGHFQYQRCSAVYRFCGLKLQPKNDNTTNKRTNDGHAENRIAVLGIALRCPFPRTCPWSLVGVQTGFCQSVHNQSCRLRLWVLVSMRQLLVLNYFLRRREYASFYRADVLLEGGSLHDMQKGRAPGYRVPVQNTVRRFFCSLTFWRFWEKRGKIEVKKEES